MKSTEGLQNNTTREQLNNISRNMPMPLQPLADRILVQPTIEADRTSSGIIIPSAHKERPKTGTVVAVGNSPLTVKVGDVVLFGKYAGQEISVDGADVLVMQESEVIGIVS